MISLSFLYINRAYTGVYVPPITLRGRGTAPDKLLHRTGTSISKTHKALLLKTFCMMNNTVDLSSILAADYEKLYESGKYTDVSIHTGKEPKSKIFFAHTLVLCTRSKFLENSLTGNTETFGEVQKAAITLEDVAPDVFEILLR